MSTASFGDWREGGAYLKDDKEIELEMQMLKVLNNIRDLRKEEAERLAKKYLHNELHHRPLKNDMYSMLRALFGKLYVRHI